MELLLIVIGAVFFLGAIHNLRLGLEDARLAKAYCMLENTSYFKKFSFFCFLLIIWAFITLQIISK